MSTKKVKSYTCKSCGKTRERIGVTSFCRQTLHIDSDSWTDLEIRETLHGFCLDCCAEVPANIMKKFLKGGEITVDHQSLLTELVIHGIKGYAKFDGIAQVSLKALNKARMALGYKAL
jgi:hypothetical protein